MRTRPATIKDVAKILRDVEDVNYHALYGMLRDALRVRGIATE